MRKAEAGEEHTTSPDMPMPVPKGRGAAVALTLSALLALFSLSSAPEGTFAEGVPELPVLRRAYPDIAFDASFDAEAGDWKITVTGNGRSAVLYRAGGRFLTREQTAMKERYRQLIYRFPDKLADPELFTAEEIERITRFGSSDNRRDAPVSSTVFFDSIYDSATQAAVERHIVSTSFLGKSLRVHERIVAPLGRAETRIRSLAQSDHDVAEFIRTLGTADAYYWRQIRDTAGRSFHSMGLAIDLLPRGWQNKVVYWNWEKNKGNDRWMLIPLTQRWLPPMPVVEVFEAEGFIWGGKWPIWDNMHFEYRPELLAGRRGAIIP